MQVVFKGIVKRIGGVGAGVEELVGERYESKKRRGSRG